jgi:CubicO group peptidase (beta-lactamase class C family)
MIARCVQLVGALSLCCAGSVSAQSDPFAAIPARMEKFVADGEIAGAVTLVGHQGRVVHLAAVGKTNLEVGRDATADTLFGIMSMTKPITATALMILVDEGKLALDDPVDKHIPSFADAKLVGGDSVRGLTIRRLLTHTSGLTGDQGCEGSLEATAQRLAQRPFEFQPGDKWQYGPSLNVCGRIVEVSSGQPFDAFLTERIFKPLGMNDTTFHPSAEQRQRLAALYERERDSGALKPVRRMLGEADEKVVPNPSGGLFSTASDMFRFYQMILAGGELEGKRIVSADAVKQMTSVQTGDLVTGFTRGNGWGLGWCIVRMPEGVTSMLSPSTFGHGGAYGTQGWVDPQRQAVFVLMIQRAGLPNSDGSDIRREFQQLAVDALEKHAAP